MGYVVTCTLCTFERELGTLDDVLAFQDDHQAAYGDDHVIEFELLEDASQNS